MDNTRLERLTAACEYLKYNGIARTQAQIAQAMNCPRPSISNALRGLENYLTDGFLERFVKAYDNIFNLYWLYTGEGSMLVNPQERSQDITAVSVANGTKGVSCQVDNTSFLKALEVLEKKYESQLSTLQRDLDRVLNENERLLTLIELLTQKI